LDEADADLLGSVPAVAVPFQMDDLGGPSVLGQVQDKCLLTESLPMTTLDCIVARRKLAGPILLKADVQGYELEVLRGATETLREAEVVLLEVSLLPYNVGAPLFSDVVRLMDERQFRVYDFCHMLRWQSDHAAFQVDVLFARVDSALRSEKPFFGIRSLHCHRFRHGTKLLRRRPGKAPRQCTMKQVARESKSAALSLLAVVTDLTPASPECRI
jgi:hypothetical protein